MTVAPKRRWTYSLRTLFVVVTIICLWFGWNINPVRERKAWRARLGPALAQPASSLNDSPNIARWRIINNASKANAESPIVPQSISCVRQLLGDEPIDFLTVSSSDHARARQLFPEAWIIPIPVNESSPATQLRGTTAFRPTVIHH